MRLLNWDQLPPVMQCHEVKYYYDFLAKKKYYLFQKRLFDLFFSFTILIVISPLFLILAIFVKLDSKGPIFYKQERITQYGRKFNIIKFRTMVENADKYGGAVTSFNDMRITRIGRIIRKTRLDEIPQLVNVLKGDMSFVGTRPEIKQFVDYYSREMYATLLLPAGITSEASILFKDEDKIFEEYQGCEKTTDEIYTEIILPKKIKTDLNALKNISIFYDFKICLMTVNKVKI